MLDRIAHRGSGRTSWISADGRVGLGQVGPPDLVSSEFMKTSIALDGAIYDRPDLLRELNQQTAGSEHTWTEAELIMAAYEKWGIDCLKRLNGVFAFALWDGRRRELWLVRDRVGVKPLYYAIHCGRVVFASEIKSLLADPDQKVEVSEAGVVQYLSFLATPGPETMFKGIDKLPPRTATRVVASGEVLSHFYWDALENARLLVGHREADLCERIYEGVEKAVGRCLTGEADVGALLSSGSDASAVFTLMARLSNRPVQAFTFGYGGEGDSDKPGETGMAQRIAEENGGVYNECLITPRDMQDALANVAYHLDEPIADPLSIMFYFAAKLAADTGVRHLQTGMGADELFFGYPNWRRWARINRILSGLPARGTAVLGRILAMAFDREGFPYERAVRAARGEPITWSGDELFTFEQKSAVLSQRLATLDREVCVAPVRKHMIEFHARAAEPTHLNWMTYNDLNIRNPEWLMMRADKMSMAFGVESRMPLLDHELIELAFSIPTRERFGDGTLKYLFLKSMRGVIRDDLVTRDDGGVRGFPYVTFVRTFRDAWGHEMKGFCEESGLLSYPGVVRLMESVRSTNEMHQARQVLGLMILAAWWKTYIKEGGRASKIP
jgi:asparagine synthase (glutamine-hydrolysing)